MKSNRKQRRSSKRHGNHEVESRRVACYCRKCHGNTRWPSPVVGTGEYPLWSQYDYGRLVMGLSYECWVLRNRPDDPIREQIEAMFAGEQERASMVRVGSVTVMRRNTHY